MLLKRDKHVCVRHIGIRNLGNKSNGCDVLLHSLFSKTIKFKFDFQS